MEIETDLELISLNVYEEPELKSVDDEVESLSNKFDIASKKRTDLKNSIEAIKLKKICSKTFIENVNQLNYLEINRYFIDLKKPDYNFINIAKIEYVNYCIGKLINKYVEYVEMNIEINDKEFNKLIDNFEKEYKFIIKLK